MRGRLILLLWLGGWILCTAAPCAAQNQGAHPLRVESQLVLIPAFVFDKPLMSRPDWKAWRQCLLANQETFLKLVPSEPYLAKTCRPSDIRGLTASDFHPFQDGVEQKVQSLTVEHWAMVVRDNLTWHFDFSYTPAGKWSTRDLGSSSFYTDPMDPLYLLAYVPSQSKTGSCHKVRVKVDRPDALVLARNQYCVGQTPSDPLNGTKLGKQLERDIASHKDGSITLSLQAGYFYGQAGQARVHVAIRAPWDSLRREWKLSDSNWTLHATIGVLGMVYRKDGTLAARFSDLAYPSYWPTILSGPGKPTAIYGLVQRNGELVRPGSLFLALREREPGWVPNRYATQIDLPPGNYKIEVAIDDGREFGRAEMPLVIDKYGGKHFALSSLMLCRRYRDAAVAAKEAAAGHFAPEFVPLVSQGVRFTPTADTRFKEDEPLIGYIEVYEPLLAKRPAPKVEVHLAIASAKTGKTVEVLRNLDVAPYERPGSTVIPIARKIPIGQLPKGAYQLEVQATDSAGGSTAWRKANFTIQ